MVMIVKIAVFWDLRAYSLIHIYLEIITRKVVNISFPYAGGLDFESWPRKQVFRMRLYEVVFIVP
jgi:hypothetical protein